LKKLKTNIKTPKANALEKNAIAEATMAIANPEKDSLRSNKCRARIYSRIISMTKIG
jgi:hypothetical protein